MKARRLLSLPPYLFEELEKRRDRARAQGRRVIDLSIGDPDLDPPPALVEALKSELGRSEHHNYPPQRGRLELKEAIATFLERTYGVRPREGQILILVGSKEGLAHLPLAVCDPGDRVLLPDPAYPVYQAAALFAGCKGESFALEAQEGFLPPRDETWARAGTEARLVFLNYPNNPTSAVAPAEFWDWLLAATGSRTVLVNDAAYAEVYFDERPAVLFARPGALERPVVEFFSFSKMFSITGWRVAFAVGNEGVIEALAHLKANVDSGVFGALQGALASFLLSPEASAFLERTRSRWRRRRDAALGMLGKLGFNCAPCSATFYLWVQVPPPGRSMEYALELLERADVLVTPGVGFGPRGEGYFRISLTRPREEIEEALARIEKAGLYPS